MTFANEIFRNSIPLEYASDRWIWSMWMRRCDTECLYNKWRLDMMPEHKILGIAGQN